MILQRVVKGVPLKFLVQVKKRHVCHMQRSQLLGLFKFHDRRNVIKAQLLVTFDESALKTSVGSTLWLDLVFTDVA